jgi:hypothetical protein
LEFLPLVVDSELEEEPEELKNALDDDIGAMEVNDEEIIEEENISKLAEVENLTEQELENVETIEQNSIDWMAFVKESVVSDNGKGFDGFNEHYSSTIMEDDSSEDENLNPNSQFSGFSIFQELFRTCDTESKLILLDEILVVGDEKEVYFLKTLLDDADKKVRDKAQIVLKELQALLAPKQQLETPPEKIKTSPIEAEQQTFVEERPESIGRLKIEPVSILMEEEDNLKSLELCFLNDTLNVKDNQLPLFELDFDAIETPLEKLEEKQEINEINRNEIDKKEEKVFRALIRNIISFPEKFKEKFNG